MPMLDDITYDNMLFPAVDIYFGNYQRMPTFGNFVGYISCVTNFTNVPNLSSQKAIK